MFKLYRQTFKTTNDGMILATPLILFVWILSLYIAYSKSVVDTQFEVALSAVTMLFMTSAFCSGWFYMVTKCVEFSKKQFETEEEKATEAMKLIKIFPDGIGKYFLTFIGVVVIFMTIILSMVWLMQVLTTPILLQISDVLTKSGLNFSVSDTQNVQMLLDKISPTELMPLFRQIMRPTCKFLFIVTVIPMIVSFLMMLWLPEVVYRDKNPLVALFTSIKKIFKKFKKSVGLFIYLTVVQVFMSFLSSLALINVVVYLFLMLVYFYFVVYVTVLLFTYYDREFNTSEVDINTEDDKTDEETKDNSDSRSDREREN